MIDSNSTTVAPQTQTEALTGRCTMTREQFYGRIASNSSVSIVHHTGYIDVFRGGQHVARWLPYPRVLRFIPENSVRTEWPPRCPSCDKPMMVKRQGGTGLPFWSCPNFPFCKGKLDFTPHPDDVIEAGDEYKAQFASLERARSMGLERAR